MPALFAVFPTNRSIIGSTLLLDACLLLLVVVENCPVIIARHRGRLVVFIPLNRLVTTSVSSARRRLLRLILLWRLRATNEASVILSADVVYFLLLVSSDVRYTNYFKQIRTDNSRVTRSLKRWRVFYLIYFTRHFVNLSDISVPCSERFSRTFQRRLIARGWMKGRFYRRRKMERRDRTGRKGLVFYATYTMRLKLPVTVGAEEKSRALYPFLPLALALGPSSFLFLSLFSYALHPSQSFLLPTFLNRSPLLPPYLLFLLSLSFPLSQRREISADGDAEQKSDRVQVQGQILEIFKQKLEFFYDRLFIRRTSGISLIFLSADRRHLSCYSERVWPSNVRAKRWIYRKLPVWSKSIEHNNRIDASRLFSLIAFAFWFGIAHFLVTLNVSRYFFIGRREASNYLFPLIIPTHQSATLLAKIIISSRHDRRRQSDSE